MSMQKKCLSPEPQCPNSKPQDVDEDPIQDKVFQEAMNAYAVYGKMESIVYLAK